jgi:hypothetical protein
MENQITNQDHKAIEKILSKGLRESKRNNKEWSVSKVMQDAGIERVI